MPYSLSGGVVGVCVASGVLVGVDEASAVTVTVGVGEVSGVWVSVGVGVVVGGIQAPKYTFTVAELCRRMSKRSVVVE